MRGALIINAHARAAVRACADHARQWRRAHEPFLHASHSGIIHSANPYQRLRVEKAAGSIFSPVVSKEIGKDGEDHLARTAPRILTTKWSGRGT